MILIDSLSHQSVGSFDRTNVLSAFNFDAVCFHHGIDFSTTNHIDVFNGLGKEYLF
jgi:hypothetical protein